MDLLALQLNNDPQLQYGFRHEFADGALAAETPHSNFLRGVKWSPDGACFLTAADDNWIRVYDTPLEACSPTGDRNVSAPCTDQAVSTQQLVHDDIKQDSFGPAMRVQAGELIYDYEWFSCMTAADPASCCFAVACRGHPVHLWDACSGQIRCSYRPYNAVDEPTAAFSLAFTSDGARLACGLNAEIHLFNVSRPGRDYTAISTWKRKQDGQPGIISCLAFNPDNSGMLAAGAYSGIAALYDSRTREALCVLEGHTGGITHLTFSVCGNYLYTGARRDPMLHCWDARHMSGVVYSMHRQTTATNQRIYFDIEPCGRHLATGGEDGLVRVFDLRDGSEVSSFRAADDTVNGCEFHPLLPLLATCSGHRRFSLVPSDHEDSTSSGSSSSSSSDEEGEADSSSNGEQAKFVPAFSSVQGQLQDTHGQRSRAVCTHEKPKRNVLGPGENVLRVWRYPADVIQLQQTAAKEAAEEEAEEAAHLQVMGEGEVPTQQQTEDEQQPRVTGMEVDDRDGCGALPC